jgi:hypothetical protein
VRARACSRTNLSYASVELNRDIGLDHKTYGLGAGEGGRARRTHAASGADAAAVGSRTLQADCAPAFMLLLPVCPVDAVHRPVFCHM